MTAWLVSVDVGPGHLAEEVFVRFLHCTLTLPTLSRSASGREICLQPTPEEWEVILPSSNGGWSIQIQCLKSFCPRDLSHVSNLLVNSFIHAKSQFINLCFLLRIIIQHYLIGFVSQSPPELIGPSIPRHIPHQCCFAALQKVPESCMFPASVQGAGHFSRDACWLLLENGVRWGDLAALCAHWYYGAFCVFPADVTKLFVFKSMH